MPLGGYQSVISIDTCEISTNFRGGLEPGTGLRIDRRCAARTPHSVQLDPNSVPQFGLIAEEVDKVNSDLVVRSEDGKVTTVRYETVNAMLLNEFLKEHRQVEEQKAGLAEMKSVVSKQEGLIAKQQKQIEVLTTNLQRVNDQFEKSKAGPQLVAENQ